MISYPLDLPASPGFVSANISFEPVVSETISPFTRESQTVAHQGAVWLATLTLPPLTRQQAAEWQAFFMKLKGKTGTFRLGDPLARNPRGNVSGTPVVSGGGQTGEELVTRGWTVSTPGILRAGDYINVNDELKMVVEDVDSDSSGFARLSIQPRLRFPPPDLTAIVTNNTTGVFRLTSNVVGWDESVTKTYSISFSAREAL